MTDLSALTADQLAEKVRATDELGITTEGHLALAELEVRASERDQAVNTAMAERLRARKADAERDQAVRERDKAVKAVGDYRAGCCLDESCGAAERADRLAAALESAKLSHAALDMAIDDGDDYGDHVGLQRHRRAVYLGQAEILSRWEEAFQPSVEPPLLPEGRLLPHKRAASQETPE